MFNGKNLEIENRIEKYQALARADDDGFATAKQSSSETNRIAKNNLKAPLTDQGSECWGDLWQCIKARYSRFLDRSSKIQKGHI